MTLLFRRHHQQHNNGAVRQNGSRNDSVRTSNYHHHSSTTTTRNGGLGGRKGTLKWMVLLGGLAVLSYNINNNNNKIEPHSLLPLLLESPRLQSWSFSSTVNAAPLPPPPRSAVPSVRITTTSSGTTLSPSSTSAAAVGSSTNSSTRLNSSNVNKDEETNGTISTSTLLFSSSSTSRNYNYYTNNSGLFMTLQDTGEATASNSSLRSVAPSLSPHESWNFAPVEASSFEEEEEIEELSTLSPSASPWDEIDDNDTAARRRRGRCAINLFGLPRAFRSLVLPSLRKHVIPHNPHCDYFLHAWDLPHEGPGRSGPGGAIDSRDVFLFRDAVHQFAPRAVVHIQLEPEAAFWERYEGLLETLHTQRDPNGTQLLYFPWKNKSFEKFKSIDNIVKMWHSIQAAWDLMENHAEQQQERETTTIFDDNFLVMGPSLQQEEPYYKRVAMIRSDVVYVTPLNIWETAVRSEDVDNTCLVLPNFARFPVNDRLAYGPYEAVRLWATRRFDNLDRHVHWMFLNDPGHGMHNERYIYYSVLPAVRRTTTLVAQNQSTAWLVPRNFTVVFRNDLCFFRARADESVWYTDCGIAASPQVAQTVFGITNLTNSTLPVQLLEQVLDRPCPLQTQRREMPRGRLLMYSVTCAAQPPGLQNQTHNGNNTNTRNDQNARSDPIFDDNKNDSNKSDVAGWPWDPNSYQNNHRNKSDNAWAWMWAWW